MRYIFQLVIVMLSLIGCSSIINKKSEVTITDKSNDPKDKSITSTYLYTVPQLPKIKKIDWLTTVIPLINQLVQAHSIKYGEVLLIPSMKNNTNMSIQLMQATDSIVDAINNKNLFKLVPKDMISRAHKALGLSHEDSLVTRSKAIGLARYVQADYVLYSVISGNEKENKIEMQLIKAQTGEIFWTGTNSIEQKSYYINI
ncbi:MAG: penicillin-binding protein activator LpoB [Arsenophonus sp.]